MRSSSVSYVALAAVLSYACGAQAQTTVDLNEVVISAGLAPMEAANYGRAYSVVTAEEIEKRGLTSVQDALRAVPGVAVNGSGRSFTQVRIRGLEGNHTLVLIDGVDAAAGGSEYSFSGLDTADIERIEVLKGPQTVFFGSRASAGVINIITKKAQKDGYGLRVEAGNGHLFNGYVEKRGAAGGLRLSFTDHKDRGVDDSGTDGERDAIHRKTLRLSADWTATERLSFQGALSRSEETYAYDGNGFSPELGYDASLDDRDSQRWLTEDSLSLGATYTSAGGRVIQDLSFARSASKSRYDEASAWSTARTNALKYRAQVGLDGSVAEAGHVLNFLLERQEDRALSPASTWQPADINYKRNVTSYALEYRGNPSEALSLQAGLRLDDNSQFRDFVSWNLAASYHLNDQFRLHASAGRASVAPSFSELYAIGEDWQGNPYLRPEESLGVDVGVEFTTADGRGVFDATLFHQVTTDRIIWTRQDGISRPINDFGKSRGSGLELSGQWALSSQIDLGVNYTWLTAKRANGTQAVRRPKHELGLNATWRNKDDRLSVTADLRLVGGNWDAKWVNWVEQPATKLPGYGVVNLSANYQLNDQIKLTGKVLNVFDKEYSDVWGYRAQDRAVWVGLNADF